MTAQQKTQEKRAVSGWKLGGQSQGQLGCVLRSPHTTDKRFMKRTTDLLRAAFAVCQILLRERDLPTLLQGICDQLAGAGLNQAALLVLMDRDSGGMITAETNLDDRFETVMAELREGRLPACGDRVLQSDTEATVLCTDCSCSICGEGAAVALCAPLRCSPGLSGFLTVRFMPEVQPGEKEIGIIGELAGSITLALRQLFATEAAKHREQELQRVEERYELALHASQAGLWDWNIRTGEMYTSPDHWELLDYRADVNGAEGPTRFIHPDDRELVLAVLNEHLTGRTDEYRIEYRVGEKDGGWTWFLDRGQVVERDENHMPVRMTGTHQNITLQKRQDEALALVQRQLHEAVNYERNFLQTVIDSAGDPVMVIDLEFNLLLINRAAAALVRGGGDIVSMQGQKCYQLFCGKAIPCQDSRFPCPVEEVRVNRHQAKLIHNPFHGNAVNNTFELDVSPLRDGRGELYGIIEVARDITDRLRIEKDLRDSQSHLYRLAHHDTLTGLPNRLLFGDRLTQALSKAARNRTGVAVLYLDLDRFKGINDTLGHDIGDALLVEVAARLQRQCRQSDTVARMGGDEFVFILEAITRRKDASVVAAKILAAMEAPVFAGGHELRISTSIGIALFPEDAGDGEELLKCADMALYAAKEDGRSTFQFYRQDNPRNGQRPYLGEEPFRSALEHNQFAFRFLPQYELGSGRVIGLTSLLRWHHPEMGVLLPDAFIADADECGMLRALSTWIFQEVCRFLHVWRRESGRILPVTVSVASRQLLEDDFLAMVVQATEHFGIPPEMLVLEVRERAIAGGTRLGLERLAAVGRQGLGLAVNDFGAAACPLGRLQQIPLQRLTLSRMLLAGALSNEDVATLMAALIDLGHRLGLVVLANGVEAQAQLELLRRFGCDLVQGPLLSPPLAGEMVAQFLLAPEKGG